MANNIRNRVVNINRNNKEDKTMTKGFALVADASYVTAAQRNVKNAAIAKYAEKVGAIEVYDTVALNKYPTEEQSRTYYRDIIMDAQAGIYQRIYIILNSKIDSDWHRENAYPKEERYAHKTNKERFADEYHESIKDTPEKFGDVDTTLHWLVSNIGPDVDVVHIDVAQAEEYVQAYSVTEEYFAEKKHREYNQEEADWAVAFGLTREVTAELLKLLPDEQDRYLYANGGMLPGSSPDAQVVKCPVCGRPTWAAPASVGFKSFTGDFITNVDDSKQMTCEHCKADLSPCFDGDNLYEIDFIPTKNDFDEDDED